MVCASDREFDDRHDKQDLKIGETKSTAYPIGKALDCPIFCRMDQEFLLEISHLGIVDLFLFQMMCFAPAVAIFSNHSNWVKVLTVLLWSYGKNTGVIVGYTRDWLFRILSNADNDFPVPSLQIEWHSTRRRKASGVLGSPIGFITGTRASPARIDTTFHTMRRLSGSKHTYKGKRGRLPKKEFQGLCR